MANQNTPGVIYLEVDEDITSAIDKLTSDPSNAIQLVTAKRSTLFQSVINLKLLKKAAADGKKDLVLVTSDRVAKNLAGRIGVAVSPQVGEPGSVPKAVAAAAAVSQMDEDEIDGGTVGDDPAPKPEPAPVPVKQDEPEEDPPVAAPAPKKPESEKAAHVGGPATRKKSRVPNIGSMQKRTLWIAAAILGIIALLVANWYFTYAKVTLFVKGAQVNASFNFTADPSVQESDIDNATLAATQLSVERNASASVQATGTKDQGTKASGNITVFNSYDSTEHPLVAGTRFVTSDGKVFRSTSSVTVPGGSLSGGQIVAGKVTVPVQADQNGDQYNVGPTRYNIPGLPAGQQAGIYGQGEQMQGGTSKTVKVITQGDIDKAKQAALDKDKTEAQEDLRNKAGKNQVVLEPSLQQNATKVDANPDVGAEASSGTVNVRIEYTQLSVNKSELSDLTRAQEQEQIGTDKEIYDDGSGSLQLKLVGKPSANGSQKFQASATAFAGTKIDKNSLTEQIKGKKYGEAVEIASRQTDVERAEIKITPAWATGMPTITKHITIEIKVANQ